MTTNQQLASWGRQAPGLPDSAAAQRAEREYIGDPFRMVIGRLDRFPTVPERKCKRDLMGTRIGRLASPEQKARALLGRHGREDAEFGKALAGLSPGEFNQLVALVATERYAPR